MVSVEVSDGSTTTVTTCTDYNPPCMFFRVRPFVQTVSPIRRKVVGIARMNCTDRIEAAAPPSVILLTVSTHVSLLFHYPEEL